MNLIYSTLVLIVASFLIALFMDKKPNPSDLTFVEWWMYLWLLIMLFTSTIFLIGSAISYKPGENSENSPEIEKAEPIQQNR